MKEVSLFVVHIMEVLSDFMKDHGAMPLEEQLSGTEVANSPNHRGSPQQTTLPSKMLITDFTGRRTRPRFQRCTHHPLPRRHSFPLQNPPSKYNDPNPTPDPSGSYTITQLPNLTSQTRIPNRKLQSAYLSSHSTPNNPISARRIFCRPPPLSHPPPLRPLG